MGARRRPVLLLDAPRGRWQGASLTWGLLAIDTIRWSGLQVGRRPDPIAYGRDQVVFKDYTAWRSADLTTCRVLGLMTMPTPKEAMEVAEAGESYAEYGNDKPRISRVDLTRDLLVPGMTVDRLAEGCPRVHPVRVIRKNLGSRLPRPTMDY